MAITQEHARRLPVNRKVFAKVENCMVELLNVWLRTLSTCQHFNFNYFFSIEAGGWPIIISVPRMYACTWM
jgi:hypothetical protein